MKRFLSVFLSVCMIMSTVSFAAPFMVNTGINAGEVVETESTENNDATVSAETIKVNFVGDIATEFASINASVGDTLDLSDYLDVEISDSAKAEHKRFNGWMPDGAEKLLTTDTVTVTDTDGDGVMYLVALVNHDFNFALEANRNMVSVYRATPAVTDKTIGLTATNTMSQLRIIDGVNGADFEIDTSLYKGVSIYYCYNASVPTDSITSFASGNFNWLYGLGISTDAISTTSTKWTSEPEVCPPRALAGWGSTGTTFMKDFDVVKDASGNVLYCGVPVTVETSTTAHKASYSCLEETWPGKTLKSMAMLLRGRNKESWNVRYLRFVPTVESVKPGLNIWTGSKAAYDFDDATIADFYTGGTTTLESEGTNKYMKLGSALAHFTLKGNLPVIPSDRKVRVSFNFNASERKTITLVRNVMNNTTPAWGQKYASVTSANTWNNTYTQDIMGTEAGEATGKSSYITDDTQDIKNVVIMAVSAPIYIDNVSIVPAYKLTYNANGGSGSIDPVYFFGKSFTDLEDGSALSYDGKIFKGWATSANGEAITEVKAIPGSDVTLYAVWEELKNIDTTVSIAAPVAGETAQTTVTGTGFTGTITWSPALTAGKFVNGTAYTATVTLNIAEGYTAGNVAENGFAVAGATVQNTAGASTFTAAFAATELAVAKPGLNVWTGTTDAFTFEGAVQSDFAAYGSATLVNDGSNAYMNLAGNFPHFTLKNTYGVVDKDRPVKATFKVLNHSSAKDVRIIRNVTNNLNPVLGQHIIGVPGSWSTLTSEILGSSKDITNLTNAGYSDNTQDLKNLIIIVANDCTSGNVYVDDVSFVPAYKVTYNANGGTGSVEPEYFFGNTYSELADGSALTNANGEFAGWSLTKDGDAVSSVTATPGSDVTLYAVWADYSDKEAFTYELTSTTAGVANGIMTFFAPTSAHKSAEVYFANDDGIMDGYTPFVTVNFTKREEAYTVSGNRAFAMGATQLHIYFSGEGAENVVVEYDIPEANRLTEETPLYKYFVVSDLHLGGSANNIDYFYMQWQSTDPIRTRAFGGGSNNRQADVFNNGADFVIVNGDLVNYGSYDYGEETGEVGEERYWNVLDSFIEERLNNNNVPVFLTNGNHEFQKKGGSEQNLASFIPVRLESVINGQLDYLTENYGDNVVITKDETNPDALYYAADMMGAKYIFMSTPEMSEDKTGSSKTVSDKQLKFIEEQLYDGENSGKTVFVITHLPITDLTNATEVDALFEKHPNTIVFNSHTHYNLGFDTHYTVVGDMTTSYTTSDTSATSYLATGVSNSYETGYNAGQFVEVYEDKIIIKGRKFADNSMFFGHALYIVETPDEGDVKSVAIDGTLAKDSTVTAVVNGSVPADDDSYSYEWIIAGETVSTEKSIKLTNAGVKVILRVTGADGSYASVLSDVVADYTPESYDVSSIRTDAYTGIRFKASVTKQQKEVAVEYGFIVTLKKLLGEKELNHDSGVKYVEGINYGVVDGKEVDKIHEIIGDDIFFTAVVYNIPKTQEAYSEEFVVRPFTKVEGTYYYGDSIERSVLSVAASLRDSNYKDLTAQAIETVKEILTVCGESTEA